MKFNDYGQRNPKDGISVYEELIDYCDSEGFERPGTYLRMFLADLYDRISDEETLSKILRELGFASEDLWMVIGPFEHKNGFSREFSPERTQNLEKTARGKSGPVRWQHVHDDRTEGYIDLKPILGQNNWSVGYALIYVDCPDEREVEFRLGSNESITVWLNDAELWKLNQLRTTVLDHNIVPARLNPGLNKVLIKVCNRLGEWGCFFRITDRSGKGFEDIRFISPEALSPPA
jgi:hypothetical protein